MDNSFFAYIQQLELLVFFSGYPLLYASISLLAGTEGFKKKSTINPQVLLPLAYALTGCLYLGLQLKNLYPNYLILNIRQNILLPFLFCWGLSSILFFIPVLRKKIVVSLLHSLMFFAILAKDLFLYAVRSTSYKNDVRNVMKIYSYSLLLNFLAFLFVFLIAFLFKRFRGQKN